MGHGENLPMPLVLCPKSAGGCPHWCQLNVKASLERALRATPVTSLRLVSCHARLRLKTCGRAATNSIDSLRLETRF
jgi:hypothetical protein